MAKGDKKRHDAAVVKDHLWRAREWGRISGQWEREHGDQDGVIVHNSKAYAGALVAVAFLTPGAYQHAFRQGFTTGRNPDSI